MSIYLDYAASTPVDPRVADIMMGHLTQDGIFANPASHSHAFGWSAEAAVNQARESVAELINASPKEIIWTSGATESDNLALKGAAQSNIKKGKHLITTTIEHKAVLDTCAYLARNGFEISYVEPNEKGIITADAVEALIRDDTTLVSVMYVNNETGMINNIAAIGRLTRERDIIFHVDAAQAAGKIAIDVKADCIDLLSLTAHKLYGPKGIGVLYVGRKPRVRLQTQIHGGGHERGFRSGTLATHQIVGMGEAYRLAKIEFSKDKKQTQHLAHQLWKGLSALPNTHLNGSPYGRIDNVLNIRFDCVDAQTLMREVSELAVSSGSACVSANFEPSYVLRSMGLSDEQAASSIRFSLGRMTTMTEIDRTVKLVVEAVEKLRRLSPK